MKLERCIAVGHPHNGKGFGVWVLGPRGGDLELNVEHLSYKVRTCVSHPKTVWHRFEAYIFQQPGQVMSGLGFRLKSGLRRLLRIKHGS